MTTGQLITDLRNTNGTSTNLDHSVALTVRCDQHLRHMVSGRRKYTINDTKLMGTKDGTAILRQVLLFFIGTIGNGHRLTNDNIITCHMTSLPMRKERRETYRERKTVVIKLVVIRHTEIDTQIVHRLSKGLIRLILMRLGVLIRTEVNTSKEATINTALIDHQTIFLVITRVGTNGNTAIDTGRKLSELQLLHSLRTHKRSLRVVENMTSRVESLVEGTDVHTHSLLTHRTLVGVTRGLVVVREGNDTCTHTQDHRRMDLTVGEGSDGAIGHTLVEHLGVHGNHGVLLLFRTQVLDQLLIHKILEGGSVIVVLRKKQSLNIRRSDL